MKHSLLMVDVKAPGSDMEAEPMTVQTDGRLAVLTLDDGTRIAAPVASLVAALAVDDIEARSAA